MNFYGYNVVLLHKLMGHFIMFGGLHRDAVTVKVCLHPQISWEKPIFYRISNNIYSGVTVHILHVCMVNNYIKHAGHSSCEQYCTMKL